MPAEELIWFTKKLEETLKNYPKESWHLKSNRDLMGRLHNEVFELIKSTYNDYSQERIIRDCCHVAIFAMMIADNNKERTAEEILNYLGI